MCESIVVVGAALSADVDAPTERVHSAPGARRGQSPKEPTGERAGRENTEEFRVGSHGQRKLARFAVSPTNRAANSPRARGRAGVSPRSPSRYGWSCVGFASRIARNCWVESMLNGAPRLPGNLPDDPSTPSCTFWPRVRTKGR